MFDATERSPHTFEGYALSYALSQDLPLRSVLEGWGRQRRIRVCTHAPPLVLSRTSRTGACWFHGPGQDFRRPETLRGLGPGGPRGTRALADVARLARRSGQRLIDGLHIELYEPVCMASYLARPGTRSAFYSWRRERRAWRCLPLWMCSVSVRASHILSYQRADLEISCVCGAH